MVKSVLVQVRMPEDVLIHEWFTITLLDIPGLRL